MTDDATLYAGGLVFDGLNAPTEGQAVLVENGRIAKVAPADSFQGFAGQTVDTAGATLMPGLIDCHVHICHGAEANPAEGVDRLTASGVGLRALEHARRTLEGGIVAVRDCGGKDYIDLDVRDALNAGRFPGPVMRASGRMICMTGGHGNRWGLVADGVEDVIKAVRTNVHKGVDVIKIMATGGVMTPGVNPGDAHYTAEEMKAGISEARFIKSWTEAVLTGGVAQLVLHDIYEHLDPADQPYFRESREKRFGKTLEEVQAGREERVKGFRLALMPLRLTLRGQAWVAGDAPGFADHMCAGPFLWARAISPFRLLEDDDPVAEWLGRVLDAYDGVARSAPGYD